MSSCATLAGKAQEYRQASCLVKAGSMQSLCNSMVAGPVARRSRCVTGPCLAVGQLPRPELRPAVSAGGEYTGASWPGQQCQLGRQGGVPEVDQTRRQVPVSRLPPGGAACRPFSREQASDTARAPVGGGRLHGDSAPWPLKPPALRYGSLTPHFSRRPGPAARSRAPSWAPLTCCRCAASPALAWATPGAAIRACQAP